MWSTNKNTKEGRYSKLR